MRTISVLELKNKADEFVRSVMQTGEEFQITDDGKVVALLVPAEEAEKRDGKKTWATTLDQLAEEIERDRKVDI